MRRTGQTGIKNRTIVVVIRIINPSIIRIINPTIIRIINPTIVVVLRIIINPTIIMIITPTIVNQTIEITRRYRRPKFREDRGRRCRG